MTTGVGTHRAVCVDDEGKIECVCDLAQSEVDQARDNPDDRTQEPVDGGPF